MSVVDRPVPSIGGLRPSSRVSDAPSSCSCARGSIDSPSRPSAPAGRKEQRLRSLSMGARAFIPVALAGAALLSLVPATPVAAATPKTEAQQIIRIAMQHRGAHWHYGATGPRAFDCSGLVIYAFRHAGDGKAVANGHLRSARALYHW